MEDTFKRGLIRILLIAGMAGIAFTALVAAYAFATSFLVTPYRFVALFLLVIFASNLLAKLTRLYVEL